MADAQDRNLPASERKKRKAREDGQVARSRDLAHLATVGGGGALLVALAPTLTDWLQRSLRTGLTFDARLLARPDAMLLRLGELGAAFVMALAALGGLMGVLAVAAALAAGGWNFSLKALAPNFGKLDPLAGLARMVSGDNLGDLVKASTLAIVLGLVGGFYLESHLAQFHNALALPLPAALAQVTQALLGGLALLVLVLALFAAVDVPLQRFKWAKRLKMSHQEMKQEYKDAEGNVEVKGKIKARMREMSRRRMLRAVPGADLVVMNPTHYAVALKYDDAKMAAPRVVAKGADLLALRIRDLAREASVPVLQAPPLARALYAHTDVDQEIPARLFSAVAQVLAHVYQLRAALAGQGAMPADLPPIPVPDDLDPNAARAARPVAQADA